MLRQTTPFLKIISVVSPYFLHLSTAPVMASVDEEDGADEAMDACHRLPGCNITAGYYGSLHRVDAAEIRSFRIPVERQITKSK